jgi:RNA polymerase sigma-70 factor (TIGR02943 family)
MQMNDPITKVDPSKWLDLHGNTLYAYATSFLRNRELAEEVVQETFLAALKHKDQFRGVGTEGAWLMGILKRKLIDHLRSRARQPLSLENPDTAVDSLFDKKGHWLKSARASSSMRLDRLEAEEFREIFSMCFQGLPKAQASTFLLKEVQQESTEEVCKQLAISATNLYVLMHRARIRLAECMKSRLDMGDS